MQDTVTTSRAELLVEAPASQCARRVGLHYLDHEDQGPGLRRRRHGKTFRYFDDRGRPVRAHATLARIRALAIPPAWTHVWISPEPRSHLQATGRDERGQLHAVHVARVLRAWLVPPVCVGRRRLPLRLWLPGR